MGLKPILRTTTSLSALTLSVGLFDPQKPVPDMTYNVSSGTLNHTQSINQSIYTRARRCLTTWWMCLNAIFSRSLSTAVLYVSDCYVGCRIAIFYGQISSARSARKTRRKSAMNSSWMCRWVSSLTRKRLNLIASNCFSSSYYQCKRWVLHISLHSHKPTGLNNSVGSNLLQARKLPVTSYIFNNL